MEFEQKKKIISNERAEELQSLPTLSEILPYQFKNRTRVDGVSIVCAQCEKEIHAKHIHAKVDIYEHSLAVEAYAACFECRVITPAKMRFSDDGGILAADAAGNWMKKEFLTEKAGWFSRLKALFSSH